MSMGKSVTSYILGHAICGGYIDGVDARINDWPVIENTLYHNQKLIDFLNMSTGDQKYIDEYIKNDGTFRLQVPFRDGIQNYSIKAIDKDGVDSRNITMKFERVTPVDNTNPNSKAESEWF